MWRLIVFVTKTPFCFQADFPAFCIFVLYFRTKNKYCMVYLLAWMCPLIFSRCTNLSIFMYFDAHMFSHAIDLFSATQTISTVCSHGPSNWMDIVFPLNCHTQWIKGIKESKCHQVNILLYACAYWKLCVQVMRCFGGFSENSKLDKNSRFNE